MPVFNAVKSALNLTTNWRVLSPVTRILPGLREFVYGSQIVRSYAARIPTRWSISAMLGNLREVFRESQLDKLPAKPWEDLPSHWRGLGDWQNLTHWD